LIEEAERRFDRTGLKLDPSETQAESVWVDAITARTENLYLLRNYLAELKRGDLGAEDYAKVRDLSNRAFQNLAQIAAALPEATRRNREVSTRLVESFLNLKAIDRQLEAEAQGTKVLPAWVRVSQVASQLPPDAILLEYIRAKTIYAAYVIFPDPRLSPVYVPLPDDDTTIGGKITTIRRAIQEAERLAERGQAAGIAGKTGEFIDDMDDLKSSLLDPVDAEVRAALPGQSIYANDKWLIISPVADVWLVPFQAMRMGASPFAIQDRRISYQVAARELILRPSRPRLRTLATGLVVYDPDFGPMKRPGRSGTLGAGSSDPSAPAGRATLRPRWVYRLQAVSCVRTVGCWPCKRRVHAATWQWVPCQIWERSPEGDPGGGDATLAGEFGNFGPDHLRELGSQFSSTLARKGIDTRTLTRASASEPSARDASNRGLRGDGKSPSVLALCTHGFYLGDSKPGPSASDPYVLNPALSMCGLALARANRSTNRGIVFSDSDGLLRGSEAAKQYDLDETELVVLIACQTGEGKVETGNNVVSLRHAFTLAGARAVVASSWVVEVRNTERLMARFFDALIPASGTRENTELALQSAQKALIAELGGAAAAHPYFWASFSLTGFW
jgi:hypothetical protein